uniref:Uncharacterized protein n=1 Tax=Ditylenchus dipsaci TaxID=166011 RepID=A0A915CUH8_9BILA
MKKGASLHGQLLWPSSECYFEMHYDKILSIKYHCNVSDLNNLEHQSALPTINAIDKSNNILIICSSL